MVVKTLKYIFHIIGALIAGFMLLALLLGWKLSQGPISLPQLTPYIAEAVSQNARGLSIRIKDTVLSWEGWERTLDIQIIDTDIFTRDGRRLATVPQASISLSGSALMKGILAPRSIELIQPEIHLMRHGDGTLAFEFGDGMTVRAERAFRLNDLIGTREDKNRPLSYLSKITISQAELDYQDRQSGLSLKMPSTTLDVERIGETIILDSELQAFISGKPAQVNVNLAYNLTTEILDAQAKIHRLVPSDLAGLIPELGDLSGFQFPLEGGVNLSIDKEGEVRSFFADLKATEGVLNLPAPVEQTLALDTFSLRAGYEDFNERIHIDELLLALKPGSVIKTPAPIKDEIPMEVIRFKGDFDTSNDVLSVQDMALTLGDGPTASLNGSVAGLWGARQRKIDLVGELLNVNPTNLHHYWPKGLSDDARDWVLGNISEGIVHRAGINLSVELNEKNELKINHVNGDMEMEGLTVSYLKPLPPATGAKGWAKFNDKEFNIIVTGGGVGDIRVKEAQIDIKGLDEYDQRLNLDMTVEGSLRDTLTFVDQKPLGFASALGINPKKASGDTTTRLEMSFLLLNDLDWDGVDVKATSKGHNITITDVIFDEDLSKGEIGLSVDKNGMDVEGKIVLGSIPADLQWRENFSRKTLFKRRFLLDGMVTKKQRTKELRLDFPPFNDKIINGPVHVDATITEDWQGGGVLESFVDLQGARIDIPVLHWMKNEKTGGQAYAKVNFNKERLIGVPYFSVESDDLKASGSIALDAEGSRIQTMQLTRFEAGRTKITQGTILYSPKTGWELDIAGESVDLTAMLKQTRESTTASSDEDADTDLPGTFSGRFDKVWLDEEHSLQTVAGALSSDGKIWTQAHMTGQVGGGAPFMIDLSPDGVNRRLKMETKDAGALLRALDLFDDMKGGDLLIEGVLNDEVKGRPLVGTINVRDYRITEVPALAKLLSLVALTGVVDSMQGEGIGFTRLVSPFKYNNGIIEFKEGRTNGISIGLTWEGKIFTNAKIADIQGTIVPAYGLNSLLGNVPLLGTLFSAGEKGGGLFAWTYNVTGDLEDPQVRVNPVSALAPGFLRKLFQNGDTTENVPTPEN